MTRSVMLRGLLALLTCSAAPAALRANDPVPGKWEVHEWGTFLSVQGSNGVNLGGLVESEEHLPRIVIERNAEASNRIPLRRNFIIKVEKPVTYFYTDRPRHSEIRVDMKGGLLMHWYPSALHFGPHVDPKTAPTKDSYLHWSVNVVPEPATKTAKDDPSRGMPVVAVLQRRRACAKVE